MASSIRSILSLQPQMAANRFRTRSTGEFPYSLLELSQQKMRWEAV